MQSSSAHGLIGKNSYILDWYAKQLWYQWAMGENSWPILTDMQSSLAHQSNGSEFLHINWYAKQPCTWSMGQILTYWLISKHTAHGRWVKFLHIRLICKAALHISLMGQNSYPYWLICRAALHISQYGSELLHPLTHDIRAALISW